MMNRIQRQMNDAAVGGPVHSRLEEEEDEEDDEDEERGVV